jgi:NAD(P)-dependent dehydrogenase (short-subunit alcohol dehydrogenase family)
MAGRLKDKVALVVGAGSIGPGWGNGKATAVLFAREGAKIFAVDRDAEAAAETRRLVEDEGGACHSFAADITRGSDVRGMVAGCLGAFGRIDILHNNVGIAEPSGVAATSEESWDRVFAVNMRGMFLSCKEVLPHMEKQGRGAIVNISSIAGLRWTGITYPSYNASKAAVIAFTQNLAIEYARKGIRANVICPGLMNTPMVHKALAGIYAGGDVAKMVAIRDEISPTGRMGDAWDVAYAALYLASDEAKYVNGHTLVVDGGLTIKCA